MSHIFWARILRPTVEVDVRGGAQAWGDPGEVPGDGDGVVPDHAPRDTLEGAGEYINRAVGPAVAVRGLEPPFLAASAVADDLLGYLVVLSRLEEVLHFLSDNCGIASQWLSFAEYLGDRSLADPCFVSDLAEVLSHLKTPSANLDGGLLVAALDILEDEFCRLLKEHSASLAMKEPNYSRPRLHLRAHCRGRSAPPPPPRPTPRCPPARGRFTGGGDTARRRHSQPAAALAFSCIAAAAVTSSPASL
ncbi:Exo70 exocyst complex subunit-like [Oryza sativa Japonica Group]|uniref:Exo70 exocyst complex subunit-like n=1 Tax=Oryza sativa subsp. japonica TaxID=39947 RepID=Q5JMC6_ORYSJ|nr:Exo70 exocyst complex subunit-like [Oryza sativa Japonica Group]